MWSATKSCSSEQVLQKYVMFGLWFLFCLVTLTPVTAFAGIISGTASGSDLQAGTASNLIDGDTSTTASFIEDRRGGGSSIVFDAGTAVALTKIRAYKVSSGDHGTLALRVEGSNDPDAFVREDAGTFIEMLDLQAGDMGGSVSVKHNCLPVLPYSLRR